MDSPSPLNQQTIKPRAQTTARKAGKRKIAQAPHPEPSMAKVTKEVTHGEIRDLAYLIYVQAGRPHGKCLQHWLEAESRLKQAE